MRLIEFKTTKTVLLKLKVQFRLRVYDINATVEKVLILPFAYRAWIMESEATKKVYPHPFRITDKVKQLIFL